MARKSPLNSDEAQVIALNALAFLAADGDRLRRFLGLTGLTPEAIRAHVIELSFLYGVLEHLRADQSLLLIFTEQQGLEPGVIDSACRLLEEATA